ncbi:protein FAM185A [Onthophagus taurus]|uniref:protein FAM185A n=1 Tax=Onthophagus taurus TaxID=166361 RepID=UPI000C20EF32|nr:uncharacterized protein LOC111428313 [Onthophagus taurus]
MILSTTYALTSRLCNCIKSNIRQYATILTEQFDVSQFCTVVINSPCNIFVHPLDVFSDQNKVKVSVESTDIRNLPSVKYDKQGDTVAIRSGPNANCKNLTLNVFASLKANLDITGYDCPIIIGNFYGRSIMANSESGDISLGKSQCETIDLSTNGGNITCKELTQAGTLKLSTLGKGSITTDRLQALALRAKTVSGDITVGSSYCDESKFETDFGILRLKNVHRNVNININNEGLLNITGLDGVLKAKIKKGLVDVQVARFARSSEIVMEDAGSLILRLSEECQKNTFVKLLTNHFVIAGGVNMKAEKEKDMGILIPTGNQEIDATLLANCKNAHVLIDSSSWSKMFEQSVRKA